MSYWIGKGRNGKSLYSLGNEDLLKVWRQRWFILKNNILYYYVTREEVLPVGTIPLEGCTVKVMGVSSTFGKHPVDSFAIVTAKRVYYLAAEDSSEMFDWMNVLKLSIRFFESDLLKSQQLEKLENGMTTLNRKSIFLNKDEIVRNGYLLKKGNGVIKDWRRRWCILYKNALYYYQNEEDILPLGIVEISHCKVLGPLEKGPHQYQFELVTPGRTFVFGSNVEADIELWVSSLKLICSKQQSFHRTSSIAITSSSNMVSSMPNEQNENLHTKHSQRLIRPP